jgi:hypothetical protein
VLKELPGRLSVSRFHELSDSEFGCPVNQRAKLTHFGGL